MGLKKAYCRVYQWIYNIGMKVVKWKEPERLRAWIVFTVPGDFGASRCLGAYDRHRTPHWQDRIFERSLQ